MKKILLTVAMLLSAAGMQAMAESMRSLQGASSKTLTESVRHFPAPVGLTIAPAPINRQYNTEAQITTRQQYPGIPASQSDVRAKSYGGLAPMTRTNAG